MPSGPRTSHRIAIVGASSLRGKELKQVLEDRNFPASDYVLIDESVAAGTLTEAAGEPTFFRALEADSFENADIVFFAGTAADAERNWRVAQQGGANVIDLTGALAASGEVAAASAWIPSLASVLPPQPPSSENGAPQSAYSSPAAPVIIACTVAAALAKFHAKQISVLLFPPVSERDEPGVEELESQTTSLLSFREIAQPVFDSQVAFNLLTRYGGNSQTKLGEMRNTVARETARFLGERVTAPAIQLVQAPVFYGYAFAAYADLASPISAEQLDTAFANLDVKIDAPDDPPTTNVSVAGESEIHLAPIDFDPNVQSGVWLWGAADNLRLSATNAVRIAEELVGKSK
jgi:aspartate-semialdehyde dehydrogenase